MMGNSSIDLSLANIWRNWFKFKRGKRKTSELEIFNYFLEENLCALHLDLTSGCYRHGGYKKFIVTGSKRREISVTDIRDRVVHRLLYEYLVAIYDKTFIYDAWSCRKGKGLLGVIERTQKFLDRHKDSFIWRADIKKFFDNVDQNTLRQVISLRIKDETASCLLQKVIGSYFTPARHEIERVNARPRKGMPIGNLTSQIFANIYLNELDRFVKYSIRPQAYLRYGDDFIIITKNLEQLQRIRGEVIAFLQEKLRLEINVKHDIIIKSKYGLKFLGVELFPAGRRLNKRNKRRALMRLNTKNFGSYSGMIKNHSKDKTVKEFNWIVLQKLSGEF